MADAGAPTWNDPLGTDLFDGTEPNWTLTIAIAAVFLIALVVGVVALMDPGRTASLGERSPEPPAAAPAAPATTALPTTAAPATTAASTTVPPTTAAPTTVPPTTMPPATTIAPPIADGWTAVSSAEGHFAVELPGTPSGASPVVAGPDGPVQRTEYSTIGPGGATISVSSVPVPLAGRAPSVLIEGAAAQVRRDLGGTLELGDFSEVSGAPARGFRVTVPGGSVRGLSTYRDGRLFVLSMFVPTAAGTAADASFDRASASFRLI